MKYILIASVLLLTACSEGTTISTEGVKPPVEEWREATMTHRCTEEQNRRVESEHLFCKNNTSYFSSYCYGAAIMRNCTPKVNK